jgi:hypothetical protein
MATAMSWDQGHRAASRSRSRRPLRTIRPGTENSRSRRRLGSHRRAVPVRASICIQASNSHARATISHQIWVLLITVQRQVPQPGVLRAADPVLAAGPAVPQFQVSQLPGLSAGGKRGEPVPVDIGEPELRTRMRAFFADDDPHALRPGRQVQGPVSSATHAPSRTPPSPS